MVQRINFGAKPFHSMTTTPHSMTNVKVTSVATKATQPPASAPVKVTQPVNWKKAQRQAAERAAAINKPQITTMIQEVKETTAIAQNLTAKLEAQNKLLQDHAKVTAELNAKIEAQKVLQAKYDELSGKMDGYQKTIAQLTSELSISKEESTASNEQLNAKLSSLQSTLNTLVPQLQGLTEVARKQLDDQANEIAALRQTLADLLRAATQ